MGVLQNAADAWQILCKTQYILVLGRKGRLQTITISFSPEEFPHIMGIKYASDIDFGVRFHECFGGKLLTFINNGKVKESALLKSQNWIRIEGRLKAIMAIQRILEGDFTIAEFHPERLRGRSSIDAKYVIKNNVGTDIFFVFLDESSGEYFCRSAFQFEEIDYTMNQPTLKLLELRKIVDGQTITIFKSASYK